MVSKKTIRAPSAEGKQNISKIRNVACVSVQPRGSRIYIYSVLSFVFGACEVNIMKICAVIYRNLFFEVANEFFFAFRIVFAP